jgi:hypothetical protein
MKKLILFIAMMVIGALLTFATDIQNAGAAAEAGFTFLELLLIAIGAPAGGVALLAIRVAKSGTKVVLKSLDSSPYVDNRQLLLHASTQKDKKALKQFQKINRSDRH